MVTNTFFFYRKLFIVKQEHCFGLILLWISKEIAVKNKHGKQNTRFDRPCEASTSASRPCTPPSAVTGRTLR